MSSPRIRTVAEISRLGDDALVTPAEMAALFRVDPKTVSRWALHDRLPSTRTPGGHHRFRLADVLAALGVEVAP